MSQCLFNLSLLNAPRVKSTHLLDRVVSPLDEHVVEAGPLVNVGNGGRHPEGVNGPPVVGAVAVQVLVTPFMA